MNRSALSKPHYLSPEAYLLGENDRKSNEWRAEHFVSGQAFMLQSVGLKMVVDELYEFLLG